MSIEITGAEPPMQTVGDWADERAVEVLGYLDVAEGSQKIEYLAAVLRTERSAGRLEGVDEVNKMLGVAVNGRTNSQV
jgi:hypothetical protein